MQNVRAGTKVPMGFVGAMVSMLFLMQAVSACFAQESNSLNVLSRVNLREVQPGRTVVKAGMGAGLTVLVKRPAEGILGQTLRVEQAGTPVLELESGAFETAALYMMGNSFYLVVGEFTGGAHCCGGYQVFMRNGLDARWRHLGAFGTQNGGPDPADSALFELDGHVWISARNNDYDYFHAGHATSLLVNAFREYAEVTPEGLRREWETFRQNYLSEAREVGREIDREAAGRRAKPNAILDRELAFGNERYFSDNLGQLLVKRALLTIMAGEKARAEMEFRGDVSRWYGTKEFADSLWAEMPPEPGV